MSYFSKSQKPTQVVQLLKDAIDILVSVGIPITDKTERKLERMAMSFMAVAGVTDLAVASTFTTALNSQTSMGFNVSGAGFDDVAIAVNLTGVNDLNGLVTAINEGIAAAGAGVTAAATAFKGANISASISSDGKSFSLTSADSAFSVEAGTSAAIDAFMGTLPLSEATKAAGGLQSKEVAFTALTGANTQKITIATTDEAGEMQSIERKRGVGSAQGKEETP